MKQPDLGKKITELRKAKGMTQEELVEKCNVSVRTIQRIEAGEVTPRSFTVKTILAALDYDLEKIRDEMYDGDANAEQGSLSKALDSNGRMSSGSVIRGLNIAWVAGIIYFILTFPEAIAEYLRMAEDEVLFGAPLYILMKLILLVSFIFFQRGIILMAMLFDNYLLKVTSMILMAAMGLLFIYDIGSLFYSNDGREYAIIPLSILFGAIGVVYGFSLKRLEKPLGRVAELAGIIEMISGCLLLTVVLALLGDFIHIAAELLAIIMISKAVEIVKGRSIQISEA